MLSEDTKNIPEETGPRGSRLTFVRSKRTPLHETPGRGAPDRYCAARGTLFTHLRTTAIFHCSTPHRSDVSITTTADDPFSKRHRKENYLIVIKMFLNAFIITSVMQLVEMFTVTTRVLREGGSVGFSKYSFIMLTIIRRPTFKIVNNKKFSD